MSVEQSGSFSWSKSEAKVTGTVLPCFSLIVSLAGLYLCLNLIFDLTFCFQNEPFIFRVGKVFECHNLLCDNLKLTSPPLVSHLLIMLSWHYLLVIRNKSSFCCRVCSDFSSNHIFRCDNVGTCQIIESKAKSYHALVDERNEKSINNYADGALQLASSAGKNGKLLIY